jgi:hypothetical protein
MSAQQIIHLERDDDIDVIREKVERAQARKLLLVLPHGSRAFRSPLDFRLLRRQAQRMAIEVALVSNHAATRDLAAQEGVRVYGSVWRGKRARRWSLRRRKEAREPNRRKIPPWRCLRRPRRGDGGCAEQFAAILLILLTAAAAYGLLFGIVPTATVTLVPATQPIEAQVTITAGRDVEEVDFQTLRIPVRVAQVQVEDDGQVPTTGNRDAPDSLATGTVVFINQLSQPVQVLTDTIVSTSLGTVVRFRTTEAVELAPAIGATARAPIEALEPGSAGNVAANLINTVEGPMSLRVRVINPGPTSGGGFRQVGAVTAADKDRLRSLLLQQLQQRALAEIQKELDETQVALAETLQLDAVLREDYDQFVGEPAEFLGLTMRVLASAVVYDERDLRAQAFRALSTAPSPGFRLLNGTQRLAAVELMQVSPENREVTLSATATAVSVANLDPGVVREMVKGQEVELARLNLTRALPLATQPDIALGPDWMADRGWLERIPQLGLRILVTVKKSTHEQQVGGG